MQETASQGNRHPGGLCATCRNAPTCTFPRRADRPVRECLEFDGELRAAEPRATVAPLRAQRAQERQTEPGLCGWCDLRDACTFPRSPGGVWFCEEYQ